MKSSIYLSILTVLIFLSGCKKDPNNTDVTSEKLGDVRVNFISGFAFNGDPLGYTTAGPSVRWRSSEKQWERVGSNATVPLGEKLYLKLEDMGGTYYAANAQGEIFELKPGATAWQTLNFADGDTVANHTRGGIAVNNAGDVVVNLKRKIQGGGDRSRVYRRAAGTTNWVRLNDRPADEMEIVKYLDNGEIFVQDEYSGNNNYGLYALKPNGGELVVVYDCNGTVIKPYCGRRSVISAGGDIYTFEGGLGTHIIYKATANGSYPINASEAFSFPDDISMPTECFTVGNGGVITSGNNGGYDATRYFIRRSGSSTWKELPEFPGDGLSLSTYVNRQGQLFSHRQQLGFPNSEDLVYRINF